MPARSLRLFAQAISVFLLIFVCGSWAAVTEQVIYNFPTSNQGYFAETPLLYYKGRFFGATNVGGGTQCNCGVIFLLAPGASGTWNYHVLYRFQGGTDGYDPVGNLVFDAAGNLYGATQEGGSSFSGAVFELSPNPDGHWTFKTIYSFGGNGSGDGVYPGGLAIDGASNLYGATNEGGANNKGTVFKLTPGADGNWSESILYSFTGAADGAYPNWDVALDSAANIYGTTGTGGANNLGTVFQISPNSSGGWTETTLMNGTTTTGIPLNITIDAAGNLFGTTFSSNQGNLGTVFEVSPNSSGTWTTSVLHTFANVRSGEWPKGSLIIDASGSLYGTTEFGGAFSSGTVFKLTPGSSGFWGFTILYSFAGAPNDGAAPLVGLTMVNGTLFGDTAVGGPDANGVIFKISR